PASIPSFPTRRSSDLNENRATKLGEELTEIVATSDKPILLSTYTTASPASIGALAAGGIPCYTSMTSAARAIKALVDYGAFQQRSEEHTSELQSRENL